MIRSSLSKKQLFLLFVTSLVIRALVMHFFIQPNNYYKQPDSGDYHNCALGIVLGSGMHRLDTKEPIFWRTPGYSLFLVPFYKLCTLTSLEFDKNSCAQTSAIWVQIFLSSLIPIILFYLAYALTHLWNLSYVMAWIAVIHPGLVLASAFLLSEGIALIFFYLFLLFLYRLIIPQQQKYSIYKQLLLAVICLSIYTWMRPMGEFVGYVAAILLCFAAQGNWIQKIKLGILFGVLFFATLFPWYYRNYKLTDEWFFCPTIGTYLNVFNAPKILRRTTGKSLIDCHKILNNQAVRELRKKEQKLKGTGKFVSNNICKTVSIPLCMSYPGYFIYDWLGESIKTTFDLYSYQLVTMANESWWYDPLEEYLPDKIADCLYKEKLPLGSRIVCWLEFFWQLFLWIGLLAGFYIFVIKQLFVSHKNALLRVWLTTIPMIGLCIGMTGGFGYARLRLPIEPLLIILSLTFWYNVLYKTKEHL